MQRAHNEPNKEDKQIPTTESIQYERCNLSRKFQYIKMKSKKTKHTKKIWLKYRKYKLK